MTNKSKILVTGAAGFIGFHLIKRLIAEGYAVDGVDNLNDYYDIQLKKDRLKQLTELPGFSFTLADIADSTAMKDLFAQNNFDFVINLAAQAGVRYSLENPQAYIQSNIVGFTNILEGCRHGRVKHLVFASSSSVYGANTLQPFAANHNVDHPISLYAASKKSNELLAHTYSSSFGLATTGLRFFTVYGPWGRPDMALFLFTKAILNNEPINVFNNGNMSRDFTYVDDIVEGIYRVIKSKPEPDGNWDSDSPNPASSFAPYRIFNIGSNNPVPLMEFIRIIEEEVGRKSVKNFLPMQIGDVPKTYADVSNLKLATGYSPSTPIAQGVKNFVSWYREYYSI